MKKIVINILVLLFLSTLSVNLISCGQKGPLYLPDDQSQSDYN